MTASRKLAAILAADVVGYGRLAGVDEDGTLARLRALREDLFDPAIAAHDGRVVKRTGDGAIVEFRSAVEAARCAVEVQNGMREWNGGVPEDRRIVFRIGIHVGDIVEEADGDLMGDGVNVAARIEGICEPGGVCLSGAAYDQVRDRVDASFADLGERTLKNIVRPVRVYAIGAGAGSGAAENPPLATRPAAPPRASIAVLPFANMSGDAEQEYFADGISEDIITSLSKLAQLFVIARNSSFTFKGKNVHIGEVGKSLGVRYVVEGSVRKSGGRVRITAQLIDAATGGHLWAERFDRDLSDIFEVQDDVTGKIVAALALNLGAGDLRRIAAPRTDNLEAYDSYLQARQLFWLTAKELNAQARVLAERASQLDPNFAPAHALLALTHNFDYINGWSASAEHSRQRARACASRALSLDDANSSAHATMGSVHVWERRHDEALRDAERAIALDPNNAAGHAVLGVVLHYAGQSKEALESLDRAMALDPYYPDMWLQIQAQALYRLGRYSEAAALSKRRILRNPDTDASRVLLAACCGQMGLVEEAREAWREALRVNPAYSLEQRRNVLPYKNPADFEKVVEGLRKAGIQEQ